jgi:hypothetical protein
MGLSGSSGRFLCNEPGLHQWPGSRNIIWERASIGNPGPGLCRRWRELWLCIGRYLRTEELTNTFMLRFEVRQCANQLFDSLLVALHSR